MFHFYQVLCEDKTQPNIVLFTYLLGLMQGLTPVHKNQNYLVPAVSTSNVPGHFRTKIVQSP